jgi:protein-S-isoprenylcysteine O-methyltransferase Ste14
MPLTEEFAKSGNWLFRWRSYLPLLLLVVIVASLRYAGYPHDRPALDRVWEVFCLLVSLAGLAVRALTIGYAPKGTSGRNTGAQGAATLNMTGMYSVVRHPLYFGNFIIGLGVFLFVGIWWVSLIYILAFALYYERIMFAEELFLRERFGQAYLDWGGRTPAFFPRPGQWRRPDLPFSFKTSLRREYPTLAGVIAAMFCLETLVDLHVYGRLVFDPLWTVMLTGGLIFYFVVRVVSKGTRLLSVEGR